MSPVVYLISSASKFLYILFTFVTIGAALSAKATDITTELGFKTLSDSSTPAFIKTAAQSVFEVRIPSEGKPEDIRFFDLSKPDFGELKKKINELPESTLSKNEKIVFEKQVEYCRKMKTENHCGLFLTFERGTAFLAGGDGSYLVTNAHLVNRFLQVASKLEKKTVLDYLKTPQWVPIFLFDRSGNLVLDPYLMPPALVKFGKPSAHAFFSGSGWYGYDSDYVVFQLPEPIGTPLKIAKANKFGENLYHIGFASCTGCVENHNTTDPELNRDRKEKGNSDGTQIYWNFPGPSLDIEMAAQILKTPLSYFDGSDKKNWIFFSSDAQVGLSGGPILNDRAEVVGVHAGSKPIIKRDGTMAVLSRGVRPPEFETAQSSEK